MYTYAFYADIKHCNVHYAGIKHCNAHKVLTSASESYNFIKKIFDDVIKMKDNIKEPLYDNGDG